MLYLNRSPYLLLLGLALLSLRPTAHARRATALLLACLPVFTVRCDSLTCGGGAGRNTAMVQAGAQLPSLYCCDNATRDALTVRGQRGFTAVLHGNWLY